MSCCLEFEKIIVVSKLLFNYKHTHSAAICSKIKVFGSSRYIVKRF